VIPSAASSIPEPPLTFRAKKMVKSGNSTGLEPSCVDESRSGGTLGVCIVSHRRTMVASGKGHSSFVAHNRRFRLITVAGSAILTAIVLVVTNTNSESHDVGLSQSGGSQQQLASFVQRPLDSPGVISFASKQSNFAVSSTRTTINQGIQKWPHSDVFILHPASPSSGIVLPSLPADRLSNPPQAVRSFVTPGWPQAQVVPSNPATVSAVAGWPQAVPGTPNNLPIPSALRTVHQVWRPEGGAAVPLTRWVPYDPALVDAGFRGGPDVNPDVGLPAIPGTKTVPAAAMQGFRSISGGAVFKIETNTVKHVTPETKGADRKAAPASLRRSAGSPPPPKST